MSTIEQVTGRGVPVRGNDIDTDRIIPARFLRCVTFDGLGEHAFADDRAGLRAEGRTHPFDDERYAGAGILVVNSNFGCGSSREHAPQSLVKWGIQAIVGVSFAEIFYNNNIALGVPCFQVSSAEANALQSAIEADPQVQITCAVDDGAIRYGEHTIQGRFPAGVQRRFLDGTWDATGQLLEDPESVEQVAGRLPYLNDFVAG